MTNNDDKLFKGIPQTKEEMENIRGQIGQVDSAKTLEKAQKRNAKIEMAKKMIRMFNTEEFQNFWRMVNTDLREVTNQSVGSIKGSPQGGQGYDPLGQMAQINYIQGGLEILDSQTMTKQEIESLAKAEIIPTEELEQKIKEINQITKQ